MNRLHLLDTKSLSLSEINAIFKQAGDFKHKLESKPDQLPSLNGATWASLFFEPSTRTKISFDMALSHLSASSLNVNIGTSSIKKGESLYDTVKTIEAMQVDGLIIRHRHSGAAEFISRQVNIPCINAGDGYNEHPTQALLDCFTLTNAMGSLDGKTVVILGDILHSRVARSNIWCLKTLGAKVILCGPPTLTPIDVSKLGVQVAHSLDDCIESADCINALRVQYERQDASYFGSVREYRHHYAITSKRLKKGKKDLKIIHPGPMNRGIEIDSDVADSDTALILDQVTNGIAIRMAVIYGISQGLPHS